jgi:hypothetical protein
MVVMETRKNKRYHQRLTQTFGQRVPPLAVDLAHRGRVALEQHPLVAPENYRRTQTGTTFDVFQPAVPQPSGVSTVNLYSCAKKIT